MKYAIVEHGGKQYLAEEGGRIEVDRLSVEVGKPVEFKEVLLVTDGKQTEVGSPYVSGAKVKGKVLEHAKAKKVIVFKYKPKQRYRRTQGHRQRLTRISIEDVALPGAKAEPAKGETKPTSKSKAESPASKETAKGEKKPTSKPKAKSKASAAKKAAKDEKKEK